MFWLANDQPSVCSTVCVRLPDSCINFTLCLFLFLHHLFSCFFLHVFPNFSFPSFPKSCPKSPSSYTRLLTFNYSFGLPPHSFLLISPRLIPLISWLFLHNPLFKSPFPAPYLCLNVFHFLFLSLLCYLQERCGICRPTNPWRWWSLTTACRPWPTRSSSPTRGGSTSRTRTRSPATLSGPPSSRTPPAASGRVRLKVVLMWVKPRLVHEARTCKYDVMGFIN